MYWKNEKFALLGILALIGFSAIGATFPERAIYGADDRFDIHESNQSEFLKLAELVAVQVPKRFYTCPQMGSDCQIKGEALAKRLKICGQEKFAQELSVGECSGFLVGPNLLMTAGHCVSSPYLCKALSWVFGHTSTQALQQSWKKEQIYQCKDIVKKVVDYDRGIDVALIELDRVHGNKWWDLADKSLLQNLPGDYFSLGHPYGLPLKMAVGVSFITYPWDIDVFKVRIENFQGSSGSPLIDRQGLKVVGMMVRGQEDHLWNEDLQCFSLRHYPDTDLKGEEGVSSHILHQLLE